MSLPQTHQPVASDPNSTNRPAHPLANYQFSSDELRILRECNTESLVQRSLPFGTGFGLTAYFGVKHGYLQPNVKYGAIPKVILGAILGYFLGKFSYQKKCAEKMMRLPNSQLAEVLRVKQKGGLYSVLAPDQNLGAGLALSPLTPNTGDAYTDEFSKYGKSSPLDLDSDSRPTLSGLDDIYRPSLDDASPQFEKNFPILAPKAGVTYDELRTKNREEYLKRSQNPYSRPLPTEGPLIKRSYEIAGHIDEQNQNTGGQKNKYGDTLSN